MALTSGAIGVCGLFVGFLAGYFTRRARLCAFGAIEDAVGAGDWRRLKVFGLALAVALLATQALILFTGFDPAQSTYAQARLPWLSAMLGGLLFGLGMALVGTCSFGSLVRLGGGDMRALMTLGIFGLVALVWLRGHLAAPRIDWLESVAVDAPVLSSTGRALLVGSRRNPSPSTRRSSRPQEGRCSSAPSRSFCWARSRGTGACTARRGC